MVKFLVDESSGKAVHTFLLEKELNSLADDFIFAIITSTENYTQVNIHYQIM